MFDNVALMLLSVLTKIKIPKVYFAGMDGFSNIVTENYASEDLINNSKILATELKNKTLEGELRNFNKVIDIEFVTKSKYKI